MAGRKLAKGSFLILSALYKLSGAMINDLLDMPREHKMPWNYRGFFLKLYNLERSGYVASRKKNNKSFFHLTPKGRLQVLKHLRLEKLKIKKWDERWRVIIFDIPEDLKKMREYLRHRLKKSGFYPLQESVYIFPHPVEDWLDKYLEEKNLRKYCRYLTVSEIDDEDQFKEVFGLK